MKTKTKLIPLSTALTLTLCLSVLTLSAQSDLLQSGPMVGYSAMMECGLWVQTTEEADVYFEYTTLGANRDESATTEVVHTEKKSGYIARFHVQPLEPGTQYEATLYINGQLIDTGYPTLFQTQTLWQYRTDPPDIDFMAGSCFYINEPKYDRPGKPYGQDLRILDAMNEEEGIDFMMWLGDNIYLREVDWDSETGIHHRYTHMRSQEKLRPLLSKMHHYAIWDDHDYGPNDSDQSYWGKAWTESAFNQYWMNPTTNLTGEGGITGTFIWGDCQFFLLDNRYFRTLEGDEDEHILGEAQVEWLINSLRYSRASFKFICVGGQFLSDAKLYENHANYEDERATVIKALDDHGISGVVFLSGDRHSSEVTKLKTDRGNVFYDITSSALTSRTYDHTKEPNTLRVPGSMISVNNYAVLHVRGPYGDRSLTLEFKDSDGELLYEQAITFPKQLKR